MLTAQSDLLAFQLVHFGDETYPDHWFVDAQFALDYEPVGDPQFWGEEDDGLGHYEDGVKRTLTDEQIEMFRHSEMEQMARAERLAREAQDEATEDQAPAWSPHSDASSLEEELVGLASKTPSEKKPPAATRKPAPRKNQVLPIPHFSSTKRTSPNTIDGVGVSKPQRKMKRDREEEVPYEQRNKRKWEEHIASVDPVKGSWMYESKTENRLRREQDNIKDESVELDY